jgi:hypothetical protein
MWVNIFFPWDSEKQLFTGERMYLAQQGEGFAPNAPES